MVNAVKLFEETFVFTEKLYEIYSSDSQDNFIVFMVQFSDDRSRCIFAVLLRQVAQDPLRGFLGWCLE